MQESLQFLSQSLAGQTGRAWLSAIEDIADEAGYFQPLSAKHNVAFFDVGKTLLVTFESLQTIQTLSEDAHPIGFDLMREEEWSVLSFFSDGQTWFRDLAIYRYLDRLVDDGFFEDFDTVLFYGAGAAGYAACTYSVVSPGARVLALAPQATLDPRVTGWDDRFRKMRRLPFNDRYGYAPDMIDAAERAVILYDPHVEMDSMHAALFTRSNVDQLRLPFFGPALDYKMLSLDILHPLLSALGKNADIRSEFYTLHRQRRSDRNYLRALLSETEDAKRWRLAKAICDHTAKQLSAPRFKKRAQQIQGLIDKEIEENSLQEKAS
ncbi:phosphoadenosine phosphosulfate reductase [Planktotalea sp.]|uniref:phosphoadenosine phosphosulfate reductase n=1 Tax=Planktotalea sp. TaxID=2029877 RepID=UPI003299C015